MKVVQTSSLNPREQKMLREIAGVFSKYGDTVRNFGVHLEHSHFDLNVGEVMHETNDPSKRLLLIRPVKEAELPPGSHATMWSIDPGGTLKVTQFCCDDPIPPENPETPEGNK